MNKKFYSLMLVLIGTILYFYFGSKDIDDLVNPVSLSILPEQNTVVSRSLYIEKEYNEEFYKKLFAELKGWEKLPKFEDFPAVEFSNNKNIAVDINSDPIGRVYRTAIRNDVESFGINFAGKYSIADWGCGSGCQDGVIVDADTGHIYQMPVLTTNGYEARKDNRLLVQNPLTIGSGWMNDWFKMRYWEWTGKDFKLLGVYKVDLEKKEIIEVRGG